MVEARLILKQTRPGPPKSRAGEAAIVLLLGSALATGFALRVRPELGHVLLSIVGGYSGCGGRPSNERNASTSLKTIATAQFDFRSADRDWNDVKDFWRRDIAGLYAQSPEADATHTPIKLIELSVASADDRPRCDLTPYALASAKAGYWFRALLHEDEQSPSPDRFAACAYPDSPSAGKWTFIIDEENFVYRKKLEGQRGLDRYPRDPLKSGWERID
jgi:hypothetical protein